MQRTALIIFTALFAFLFVGVALAVGVGSSSPSVPPGDVAIIEDAPPGLGTISKAEFSQEMLQYATLSGLKKVPKPGAEGYEQMRDEAMGNLIANVWLEGRAEELGVEVTDKQVAERLRESGEASLFREAHFTPQTLYERTKVQLASEGAMEILGERAAKPTSEVLTEAENHLRDDWQPRTHCAEGFVVERCSGYPAFAHSPSAAACYESDPKQPVEACPAPVVARMPALPGTVRPSKPEGERLAQRPYPEVIEGAGQ